MQKVSPMVRRLAFWSIPVAFAVMALKALAWYVTGSVALLSDALESIVNVIAALVAFAAIRYSNKPADGDHQFGHHKAEYLSAVVEGVMIVVAALLIVREAAAQLLEPAMLEAPGLGLSVNLVAAAVNAIWAWLLIKTGKENNSPALAADGRHILSDVVTSAGVFVGLLLALATGYAILDPIMALIVAAHILYQGWRVTTHSLDGLMDRAVSPAEEEAIKQAIAANAHGSLGVHDLRSRRAGPAVFVDFHMVVAKDMPVGDAHEICDRIEDAIHAVINGASIAIHVEPEGEKAHGRRVRI